MTTPAPGTRHGTENLPDVPAGGWRVDPARSHASFSARVAGRSVRGRLPLAGGVHIAQPIEDSAARLTARTRALSTGSAFLDRLLTGPGFLDADAFPEISFRSELLVRVPAGWRAVGQLQVKGVERALACELDVVPWGGWPQRPPRMKVATRWVLDSAWVTSQRIPAMSARIDMTCSIALELDS